MTPSHNLARSHWGSLSETAYSVAVLPWGATEAHNYHLPYGTDTWQVEYVADRAAQHAWQAGAKVTVLPAIPFGVQTGQAQIKLCINMLPSTQQQVIDDVIVSLRDAGIRKLLLLNGHGGNNFKQMLRELGYKHRDMLLTAVNWYEVVNWDDYFEEPGDHAGEAETSVMLNVKPELVLPLDQAGDGRKYASNLRAVQAGWAWAERRWHLATKDTGSGNPEKATAEKGKHYLDDCISGLAGFLQELASVDLGELYARD